MVWGFSRTRTVFLVRTLIDPPRVQTSAIMCRHVLGKKLFDLRE
jgi:hypothetical protein